VEREAPLPLIAAHPVAFPFGRIPVGALPVEHRDGVEARADAVPALAVVG
jgi:hypothetical protein